jgi:muramoyltetrapeptide carboxypeptidase
MLSVILVALSLTSADEAILKPTALQPGDKIAFVAPSGALRDTIGLREQQLAWQAEGYQIVMPKHPTRQLSYLAGTDDERADELNQALRDPTVKAIMPVRGGYGLTRILDRLDYPALRKHPRIITGFSDTTALHLAVAAKAGVVTFHTPIPMRQVIREKEPDYTTRCFRTMLLHNDKHSLKNYFIPIPQDQPTVEALTPGTASGRLMGGNLTLICSTLATPYALQPEGKLLFLEDVHEAPYRIDRHLSQLRLSGVLDKVNGVILGSFTSDDPKETDEMNRVLRSYFSNYRVPVIWKFPVGHVPYNTTIPMNVMAELNATAGTVKLLESPIATVP